MKLKKILCYKTLYAQTQQLTPEKDELAYMSSITICLQQVQQHYDGPKNNPYICSGLREKKVQTHTHEYA